MQYRDFDSEPDEPLEPAAKFKLGGREWRVRNKGDVPLGFASIFRGENGTVKAVPFFRATIHPDDYDAFIAMLDEPDGPLTQTRLDKVMQHVAGLVLGRPTVPANDSSTGSTKTGAKSKAGSSSRVTTRRRSA